MRAKYFMFALSVPVGSDLSEHWSRFRDMSFQSIQEDSFVSQVMREQSQGLELKSVGPGNSAEWQKRGLSDKVEWYLRLGPQRAPLTLKDLQGLGDASLLDAALWTILQEELGKSQLFGPQWLSIHRAYNKFLNQTSIPKALFLANNKDWWIWLRDSKVSPGTPALIRATHEFWLGLRSEGRKRAGHYFQAYQEVPPEQQNLLGTAIFESLFEEYGTTPAVAQVLAEASPNSSELLKTLSSWWRLRGENRLAADALAMAYLNLIKSGKSFLPSEALVVAQEEYLAAQYVLAAEFYKYSLDQKESDLNPSARALARAGLALSIYRSSAKDKSLEKVFQSALQEPQLEHSLRDELLDAAIEHSQTQKNLTKTLELSYLGFRYYSQPALRRRSLENHIGLRVEGVRKKDDLQAVFDLMATLRALDSGQVSYKKFVDQLAPIVERFQLNSDDPLLAAWLELRAGL